MPTNRALFQPIDLETKAWLRWMILRPKVMYFQVKWNAVKTSAHSFCKCDTEVRRSWVLDNVVTVSFVRDNSWDFLHIQIFPYSSFKFLFFVGPLNGKYVSRKITSLYQYKYCLNVSPLRNKPRPFKHNNP